MVIDGHALIHRAWHVLPPLTTQDGTLVNAVYGFTAMLLKVIKDIKPEYLVLTFDLKGPTHRHEEYKEYKAHREAPPDELIAQFDLVREVVRAFNIPIFEKQGFEADDLIGTLVKHSKTKGIHKIIVTGDMDALQLVDAETTVMTVKKGATDTIDYGPTQVKEKYGGLAPEQLIDFKSLRGDPSDNIPGVKGIGEKTAITLLSEFKNLDGVYKNIDSPKIKDRVRELLKEYKKDAYLSQKLAAIKTDVPIKFSLNETITKDFDVDKAVKIFQKFEFKSLINQLPKSSQPKTRQTQLMLGKMVDTKSRVKQFDYTLINSQKDFDDFYKELAGQKLFAFDTETSYLDPFFSDLLGISFSWQAKKGYYLTNQIIQKNLDALNKIFNDSKIKKVGHNIKYDLEVVESHGLKVQGVHFDTMLAAYLSNPGNRALKLDNLAFTEFGHQMITLEEIAGKKLSPKDKTVDLSVVPIEIMSDYSCEDADFTYRLIKPLAKQLRQSNNEGILFKIEVPLVRVLADMERVGIEIDVGFLKKMSSSFSKKIATLETKIYKMAGTKFNISSPQQLKEILFEKLEISTEGLGKTKTGISTAAAELEKMRGQHPIIDLISQYRELTKLQNTYLDALPELVNDDGRVRTQFNQTIAATGRLSSSNPNLQNIPMRTDIGREIRKAFVAGRGKKILSADYNQIELRIIASLANDAKMINSFKKGEDIHTRTAADINEIPLDKVAKKDRYAAKAINFGIIYGMGYVSLSKYADIPREQAQDFIDRYFNLHTPIHNYLEETKEIARKQGYAETIFGRRRFFPEISSSQNQVRAAAERAAVNHPIQGTAADLMKLAMIEIYKGLPKISRDAKMLLQVHDELVFEVPNNDLTKVTEFITDKMENIYKLRCPIETHVQIGQNWGELK